MCIKKKKRSFFDFLTVYRCQGCINYRRNEYIVIGSTSISIYPIGSPCSNEETKEEWTLFDKKLKQLLYEFALYQHSLVLLWERVDFPLEDKNLVWEVLFGLGDHIHIIDV